MLGSSQTQNQPYYNYTLILPLDDKQEKSARIRTDLDFNVDGEFTWPLSDSVGFKSSLTLGDNGNACSVEFDHNDESSSTQFNINILNKSLTFSCMQALTPAVALGGLGTFSTSKQEFFSAVNAVYDDSGNTVAASYDFDTNNVS